MRIVFSRRSDASHVWCRRDARITTRRRSGIALLVVLVALAIVSSIGMLLVRMALMHHRQAQHEAFVAQSRWLAEAAFDQAHQRLKADANLTGFTWLVSAKQLDGQHTANVVVEIRSVKESPQRREVTVVADFPTHSSLRSRTRRVRQLGL